MDFGQESPKVADLFKADYGQEDQEWLLEKGLLERVSRLRGTTAPTPAQPAPPAASAPPLLKRPTLSPPPPPAAPQPKVSGGFQRTGPLRLTSPAEAGQQHLDHMRTQLGGMGYEVEDKMPRNYNPNNRAMALQHAATGINFLHQAVPGTQDLSQKHKMKLTFQGPQITDQGVLMGAYHPYEQQPRIELNSTAEQTFWHEYGHFLDHALAGRGTHFATDIPGHKLRGMAEDLMQTPEHKEFIQNHPSIWKTQQVRNPQTGAMEERKIYDHRRHAYLAHHGEVLARFFNGYMNHHMSNAGQTPHEKFYGVESYQPHQYEHFGGRLRDLLKENSLTRSFAGYLDELAKAEFSTKATQAAMRRQKQSVAKVSQPPAEEGPQEYTQHSDPRLHYNDDVGYHAAGIKRLKAQGVQVTNNVPGTMMDAATTFHRVADGLDFMHSKLPGLKSLTKNAGLRYVFQGPQNTDMGRLRGSYQPKDVMGAKRVIPRIELNQAYDQTLWHETGHFIDHALAGLPNGLPSGHNLPYVPGQNRYHGMLASHTIGHPLHSFVDELAAHPRVRERQERDLAAGTPRHFVEHYKDAPPEIFARYFNSYLDHLHERDYGEDKAHEGYKRSFQEAWTPEDHAQLGPKLIAILKHYGVTKSFGQYLGQLHKGKLGNWVSGKFRPGAPQQPISSEGVDMTGHLAPPKPPTPQPQPGPEPPPASLPQPHPEPEFAGHAAPIHNPELHYNYRMQQLSGHGYHVDDNMPPSYDMATKAAALEHIHDAVHHVHQTLPGSDRLPREHEMRLTVQGPQVFGPGGSIHGVYHGDEAYPRIEINSNHRQTLWHEYGHYLDHSLGGIHGLDLASRKPGHELHDFVSDLKARPEHRDLFWNQPNDRRDYLADRAETLARFFNRYMEHTYAKSKGYAPPEEKGPMEEYSPEDLEQYGSRFRDILRKHAVTKGFAEYLDKLEKAEEGVGSWNVNGEFQHAVPPIPSASPTPEPQIQRNPRGYLMQQGYNVENRMPRQSYTDDEQKTAMRNTAKALDHVNTALPGFHALANKYNMTLSFKGADLRQGRPLLGSYHGEIKDHARISLHDGSKNTLWHELGHFIDHAATGRVSFATEDPSEENAHPLALLTDSLKNTPEHRYFMDNTPRIWQGPQPFPGSRVKTMHDPVEHNYLKRHGEVFARFFNAYMNHLHRKLNTHTADQEPLEDEEAWTPETLEKHGTMLHDILRTSKMTKAFAEYLDQLHKALEETRQSKPLPGAQRAARMPSGYKIPRKITRPGVRGSTLWWIDPKTGTVRYGPKPKPRDRQEDESGKVKDYLESAQPWSFMSAHSDTRSGSENDQLHAQLGQDLQSQGYQVYPSQGYYTDPGQTELRQESSYFVMGMGTKDALPLGQKYGQQTVLTHDGMFNFADRSVAPISYKQVTAGDLPKDHPQTVILTQPSHVTMVIDTGQPQSLTGIS